MKMAKSVKKTLINSTTRRKRKKERNTFTHTHTHEQPSHWRKNNINIFKLNLVGNEKDDDGNNLFK